VKCWWRIWMLLWNRAPGERWLAIMRLSADTKDGVLPESLSADLLAKAIAVRDNSTDTVMARMHTPIQWHSISATMPKLLSCLRLACDTRATLPPRCARRS
jgi:hypothetical protein